MEPTGTLTREQATLLLHDHLGEDCYFALYAEIPDDAGGLVEVVSFHGVLENALTVADLADAAPDIRDATGPLYSIGGQTFSLPALPGTIAERDHGLDYALTDRLGLRIAWPDPADQDRPE